jgi:MinD-like ATPase involved in chromosome partitioning or flagellar assembly
MSYVALFAEGSTSAAQSTPWWVSGAWGLVGTVVGGIITFFTTRSAHKREEKAERERHRTEQITDIPIRFIQAISKQAINSMKIKETMAEYQSLVEKALQTGNPAEALAALNNPQTFDPEAMKDALKDAGSQLNVASGVLA